MSAHDPGNKSVPVQITEDEAAVYDRQIRLWGLEAQQRMRNATILVVKLKGTATEAVKNLVLAGIGKIILVDEALVLEEDLGTGFFFTDEDVGKKRVDAAKARVESLNPSVVVETISRHISLEAGELDELIKAVDLVCVTELSRKDIVNMNAVCRRHGKPFYAGGTYGLLGFIFCDLLKHDYITPDRSAPKDAPRNIKATAEYCPLDVALLHKWTGMTKRQTKELNPSVVFTILAIWEYETRHGGNLPDSLDQIAELESIANSLLSAANVSKAVITAVQHDLIAGISTTAKHEFSPVCAVIGGMLAQDILKTMAAREGPIANLFTFDGNTGGGTVCRLNMP